MSMSFIKSLNEAKLHGHIVFDGLDISVEIPAGGERTGTNKKTGDKWAHKIDANYGYIKGTHSPDGEHLDCYLRKNPKKDAVVYVMHQMTVDGSKFDEDKVMLGYSNKSEAIRAFKEFTFKPNAMFGGCTEFDMEHFQVIAFSASKSTAMLTDESTYQDFKRRGLLIQGIKSPIMVAKTVSESLSLGLKSIGESITRGDIEECLDWSGLDEGASIENVVNSAYGHYKNSSYMHTLGELKESEFKNQILQYVMENDALNTDTYDDFPIEETIEELETIQEDDSDADGDENSGDDDSSDMDDGDGLDESANNFVVVLHTQMMENIGTATNPSWATAGSKAVLVQEGFSTYGQARAVAAKVSTGEIPVTVAEGAYILGIDVLPIGEYRQFHEAVELTESVMVELDYLAEARHLAGIKPMSYSPRHTPTIHDIKHRLEELNKSFDTNHDKTPEKLSNGQRAEALRLVIQALKHDPKANVYSACRSVCKKLFGDQNLDDEVLEQAVFEYGSVERMELVARGGEEINHGSRKIIKNING